VRGAGGVNRDARGNRQTRTYPVRAGEEIAMSGFQGGDEVEASVEDPQHYVIMSERVRLPANGGTHAIELVIRTKPRGIGGTVLDHEGKPLAGARVSAGFSRRQTTTDASGRFAIPDVYGSEVTVSVQAGRHVPKAVPLTNPDAPVTIRLERGRQITVHITRVQRGFFNGRVTFEVDGGGTYTAREHAENIVWMTVPSRPGLVRATVSGGRSTSVAIDAEQTEVSIASPD
jgi:hypothetical protein